MDTIRDDDNIEDIREDSPPLNNMTNNKSSDTTKNNDNKDDDDEDEILRMMALQEQEEDQQEESPIEGHNHQDDNAADDVNDPNIVQDPNDILLDHPGMEGAANDLNVSNIPRRSVLSSLKLHYTPVSLALSILFILYILRTRKSLYLSILYLTSSKAAYILIGNAMLALMVSFFQIVVQKFLNGLRLTESETISDNMRWDVTESCISLTMFRHELDVPMVIMFCLLILGKCFHWAVELRGSHLRMTEEVFYFVHEENGDDDNDEGEHDTTSTNNQQPVKTWWIWRAIGLFIPSAVTQKFHRWNQITPRPRSNHVKFFLLVNILSVLDLGALTYCASHLLQNGPSVRMLFAFEAAILFSSCMSTHGLYTLHVLDGTINILQRLTTQNLSKDGEDSNNDNDESSAVVSGEVGNDTDANAVVNTEDTQDTGALQRDLVNPSRTVIFIHRIISIWRDYRATATFIIELMAVAAKFLFTFILFIIMFTIYGLPVNIIRDLYVAYQRLRRRLSSFASFRRLTADMNTRFESVTDQAELDALGHTCIICRELMTVDGINGDIKKLPGCGHAFHKHCLREWLVHQQTCPTCRADISANEARDRAEKRRQENEEVNNDDANNGQTGEEGEGDTNGNALGKDDEHENGEFPMLCRVSSPDSIHLVSFTQNPQGKNMLQKERVMKSGTIFVCTEEKWWSWHDEVNEETKEAAMFMKTPDGFWLQEDEIESLSHLS